jgi:RNA 2',3'-cyclic 3'-phosphodiesterase
VSPEVRANLVRVEEELKRTRADLRLVDDENLHFTVKFLGEIPDTMVEEVDRRVRTLSLSRMEVVVRGLGAFPDDRRPRVVWAGVSLEDFESVSRSAQQVIDALQGVGESEDREYHPHITVARVRSPRNSEALAAVIRDYSARDFGRTAITSLKLKSSSLTPNGPTYRDVKEYVLQ